MDSYSLTAFKNGIVIVLLFSIVQSNPWRNRRQTNGKYTIDTLIVVDDRMYSWFQGWLAGASAMPVTPSGVEAKLKEYVSLVIHQANVRFANIKSLPYSVSLKVVNILINQNVLGSQISSSTGTVEPDRALDTFRAYLQKGQFGTLYDHSILLTGYILDSGTPGTETKGRAYVGRMCDVNGYSASVVQESGGFQSAHYVAHEVAHNLGSVHDGEGQSSSCSSLNRNVMASTRDSSNNSTNPWYYSTCSIVEINSNITAIISTLANCFSSSTPAIQEFSNTLNSAAGQLYPADVQCQMLHGRDSRPCLGSGFSNRDEICTSMFCLVPTASGSIGCVGYYAAEGTSCGNKKWCRSGVCEYSANAPAISDVCANGDSMTLINGQPCAAFVKANPSFCYNETQRVNICCKSCADNRKVSPGCPYGDKVSGCTRDNCRYTLLDGRPYSDDCCETCSSVVNVPSNCVDVSTIDGMRCGVRVQMNGVQGCYNTTVANSCCSTCSRTRTSIKGCPYGDKVIGCSRDNCRRTLTDGTPYADDCCGTCSASFLQWTATPLSLLLLLWICYNH